VKRLLLALSLLALAGPAPAQDVAAYQLGLKQRNGIGAPADAAAARRSFEASAASGVPAAMFMLAQMQAAGEGGARNEAAARRWIAQAAQLEYPEALQELALNEKDPQRAGELMREAAHALQHRAHEKRGPGY
jgi:TPR repeat protein